jgi:large subunit ribosomal protein L1
MVKEQKVNDGSPTKLSKKVSAGKKKAELIEQAKKLGLEVSEKNTVAELEAVIAASSSEEAEPTREAATAKAGKRSKKGIEEAEAKQEKIEHQKTGEHPDDEEHEIKKGPAPKTRSKLERRGKNYKKSYELVDANKFYTLKEAVEVLPKTSSVKFDASLEVHVNLNVDPRQADQNIRVSVPLPHGTGKTVRVAVFAPESEHEAAKKAGADIVGEDDFLQKLDKQQLDFDVLISTPQLMAKLGKYARILGPKGLMPNPKSGTVTAKPAEAVKQAKAGKVEFRVDKQGIIHQAVGKASFESQALVENTQAVLKAIKDAKPASIKGSYVQKISMTTTMGPSVKIALSEI